MTAITAIYENGVFRPIDPVELPEGSIVEIVPQSVRTAEEEAHLDRVYEILSRRYNTDDRSAAERHNEHQP